MAMLTIYLEGEGAMQDIPQREIAFASRERPVRVIAIAGGMESGAPSVAIALELPGGGAVIGETSVKLFLAAADALRAKFGSPR